jgi:hypothetical protein
MRRSAPADERVGLGNRVGRRVKPAQERAAFSLASAAAIASGEGPRARVCTREELVGRATQGFVTATPRG